MSARTKSTGTQRLGPIAGSNSSRSSTPSSFVNNKGKPNGGGGSNGVGASAIVPPSMPAGKQNLLDKDRKMVEYSSPTDKCPVCFSDRYLNPALRLLVSKCYHKMCESCIDRIFTLGPGPCPICGQIIRKTQFSAQTYEDLNVEKEVVIRRRIAKIFNKTQEDFPDLKMYNNYLEEVEDLTFNLIYSVDVEETDRRILAYQRENAEQIDVSASLEERAADAARMHDEAARAAKAERAAEYAAQDERDRLARLEDERELIKALEQGEGSAERIVKKQKAVALKRSSARMADNDLLPPNTDSGKPSLLSKYLQYNKSNFSEKEADPFEPEDPMADYDTRWYDYRDLFTLKHADGRAGQGYRDAASEEVLADQKKLAGGFDVQKSVWERAVRSAVMGLWIPPLGLEKPASMPMEVDSKA